MRPAPRPRIVLALSMALAALLLGSCGGPPGSGPPKPEGPPRIVALSPGIGETLAALGLSEFVVGRHAFDDAWPDEVPAVGDQNGIDYEQLRRLEPTHVLLEQSVSGPPPFLAQLADTDRISISEVPMLTLDDIRGAISLLASMFGDEASRERAAELLAELDAATAPVDAIADRAGRILLLYSTDPIGVAGPGSYHAELVREMGGLLAVDTGRAYQELDAEDARRLYPDSIALFIPDADPSRTEELLGVLADLDLRAVRTGRLTIITNPGAQRPGPSAIEVARSLREAISSWERLEIEIP